jgi:NitT/TauT family transport system substrate-binding protein/putative hydroxymethylpyrimidine transport system substrate-binding protein
MLRRLMRISAIALFAAVAVALPGCGGGSRSRTLADAALILDFTPNAVHAGIYEAHARGYDRDAGVRLHVLAPAASTDSIKLLETGRVDFAILDIHDLAIAREHGADIVGVMAIVERPLAAVIAAPSVASPRDLEGELVGITGVPSDTAVLRSTVSGAGGNPRRVRTITIGFNAVPALLARRVQAATAFWNDEGVTLQRSRPGFHVFRVDAFRAPAYPELILCATRAGLRARPALSSEVVAALVRGYRAARADPAAAAAALESAVPGLDPRLVAAQLQVLLPAFATADGRVGLLERPVLERWARWEAAFGIVRRPPDISQAFDPSLVASAGAG